MRVFNRIGRFAAQLTKRFLRSERGNTAMIFALASIGLVTASGAAIDWSRAMVTKTRLSEALDAAGLAVGTTNGLSQDQLTALAQKYFDANYPPDAIGVPGPVSVSSSGLTLSLSVSASVPTTLLGVAHINSLDLSVTNQIVRAVTKLRVALVLDNTGSMNETDATGTSKISALKTASDQLLTQLQNAAITPGDVQIAIVPFSKDVNVGTANVNANWIRWTEWDAANGTCSKSTYKSKSTCQANRGVWTPKNHSNWNGCVMDRDQNNDVTNATTIPGTNSTLFPAEQYAYCTPASMNTLSFDWSSLHAKVTSMVANGSTNQTIGLALGWLALSQVAPFNAPAVEATTQNVIIFLSDGMNTQDRWYGNGSTQSASVDNRMALACANAKAANIKIYTVLVMAGNSSILSNCASDPSKYFELTTAGEIVTAFNTIGTELANLHLAR